MISILKLSKMNNSEEILPNLNEYKNFGDSLKSEYESIWYRNELFFKGVGIDTATINQYASNLYDYVKDLDYIHIENSIKPLAKKAQSIICNQMSRPTALPATSEIDDIQSALVANEFLKAREILDCEELVRRNDVLSTMLYGECARYTRYNPILKTEDGYNGDIETLTVDPSQYCRSIMTPDGQPEWVIFSEVYDVDTLKYLYPGKNIQSQGITVTRYGKSKLNGIKDNTDKCMLNRMFIRENKYIPNGLQFVWTGTTMLQKGDLPDGIFPFVIFQWLPINGQEYPEGFIEPLVKPQITININRHRAELVAAAKARPPLVIQGNGEFRQENKGYPTYRVPPSYAEPRFMQFPHDLQEVYNEIQMAREELMELAGLRETSLGRQPRTATATQVAMLTESDTTGIAFFKSKIESTLGLVYNIKLKLAQKYFKSKRMIRLVGLNGKIDVRLFLGADLKGAVDVIIKPAPYVSEAMRQNILMQLITAGAFTYSQGIEDEYSKMSMILASGLPDAREIVENIIGDKYTFEYLQELNAEIKDRKNVLELSRMEGMIQQSELQNMQLASQSQQMQQMVQNPELASQQQMQQPIANEQPIQ